MNTYVIIHLHPDWMLNGRPLPSGTKFIPSYEFGEISLVIDNALLKDAGLFKCTATNNKGIASTSGTLKVVTEADGRVSSTALHPSGAAGLAAIQKVEMAASGKLGAEVEAEESSFQAPRFTTDLPAEVRLSPDQSLDLECSIEPKNDSALKIDWYHNGLPLKTGARVMAACDFGFVSLKINDMQGKDAGMYTCKASNHLGSATTFVKVTFEKEDQLGVDFTTKHPKGKEGLESIAGMEASVLLPDAPEAEEEVKAPVFVTNFEDGELGQGANGHFEANLEPRTENMTLEWFFNGKSLKESKKQIRS